MDHPLCDAAFRGDVTRLNRLLEQPEIQTELNDELVEQCFINAITEGHLDIAKALISLPPAVFDFTRKLSLGTRISCGHVLTIE